LKEKNKFVGAGYTVIIFAVFLSVENYEGITGIA
jgi:hypothetical protein